MGGGSSSKPNSVSRVSRKTEEETSGIQRADNKRSLGARYLQSRRATPQASLFGGQKKTLG